MSISGQNRFNSIMISPETADIFQWRVGSTIETFGFPGYNSDYRFVIRGIINSAPGFGPLFFGENVKLGSFDNGGYAIVHEDLLANFGVVEATTFILKLNATGSDPQGVMNQIRELHPSIRGVYTSSFYLETDQEFLQLAGVQGILTLNLIGAIIICLIGISSIYQNSIKERFPEFALFRTLGATQRRIVRLVTDESTILSLLGIFIGIITSIFFSLGYLISSREITMSPNSTFMLELVLPFELLLLNIISILFIVIIINLLPLRRLASLEINEILRGE
jgi:putative ABC transport system permease protein